MDISFHYFAVKTVALAAGFSEEGAQRIAEYSQFVDDFNWNTYRFAKNIPDYIKEDPTLDIIANETLKLINPVTTGFSDWFDMATLIMERSQKFTVAPFHFIPLNPYNVSHHDYRTVPAALHDNSFISDQLDRLAGDIERIGLEDDTLMRMGMLMHTFADTYAHQLFSGFDEKCNSVKLTLAVNNITGADETEKYKYWVDRWISTLESRFDFKLPGIGHMVVAHVPDLTHISFEMEYINPEGEKCSHSRSNTAEFIRVCRELYRYMRNVLGDDTPARMSWDDLAAGLSDGFAYDAVSSLEKGERVAVADLIRHWSAIFPRYSYHYDSEEIKGRFIRVATNEIRTAVVNGKEVTGIIYDFSDEFYKFNLFADRHLIALYGRNAPRS